MIIGIILGFLCVKGLMGILTYVVMNFECATCWTIESDHFRFAAVSSLIVFFYTSNVQNVDPEEYGGMIEIIKEGFMTGFATFLVGHLRK